MDIQPTPYTPRPTATHTSLTGTYGTPPIAYERTANGELKIGLTTFGASQLDALATQGEKVFYVKLDNDEGDLDGFTVPAVAADGSLPAYPEKKLDIVESAPGVLGHVLVGTVQHSDQQLSSLCAMIRGWGIGTPWTPPAP